jgi:solute carrier family 25 carnitine/acylcarnitine transporter 20/29
MDFFPDFLFNNHYVKGAISGMFGIILSQPIDSIKTHYQVNPNNKFKYTIRNFYRGVSSPLLGVGLEKAMVFGTYNYFRNNLNYNIPVCGAISGLVASTVVAPYERIKILSQTNQKLNMNLLKPSYLYKGFGATFTREVPGFAIYFTTYEYLKHKFYTSKNKDINIPASFLFGGLSGSMAWIFIYPQDRIKTIIQSNTQDKINIKSLIQKTYAIGGLKHFYQGFSFAIGRAILLHSGTFAMMEILNIV